MIHPPPRSIALLFTIIAFAAAGCAAATPRNPMTRSTKTKNQTPTILRRAEVMSRKPDTDKPSVRVWTMQKNEESKSRTNLVEMKGKLSYHVHPDAEHTLMVLEGRVCAWHGSEAVLLETGDYISIPAGVPHKYETVGERALLLSFDAPAYDPNLTQAVSEEGVTFAPCPTTTSTK